jgi:hypothetical protein
MASFFKLARTFGVAFRHEFCPIVIPSDSGDLFGFIVAHMTAGQSPPQVVVLEFQESVPIDAALVGEVMGCRMQYGVLWVVREADAWFVAEDGCFRWEVAEMAPERVATPRRLDGVRLCCFERKLADHGQSFSSSCGSVNADS